MQNYKEREREDNSRNGVTCGTPTEALAEMTEAAEEVDG